jgi:integrase
MYKLVEYQAHTPWNKGKLVGQKPPLKRKEVWAIRVKLQIDKNYRDLAMFNLAIDSKLRACDLVKLRLSDVSQGGQIASRAIVMQQKTKAPVQFEITQQTRDALGHWVNTNNISSSDYLFPSKSSVIRHISTRQYARVLKSWLEAAGLDSSLYGTHSLRRTKPAMIYRQTKNLRAVQLLLGHGKLESTVRYLGIEVDDALEISEQVDI